MIRKDDRTMEKEQQNEANDTIPEILEIQITMNPDGEIIGKVWEAGDLFKESEVEVEIVGNYTISRSGHVTIEKTKGGK